MDDRHKLPDMQRRRRMSQRFATLGDALKYAKALAKKHQGEYLVVVDRFGPWPIVRLQRKTEGGFTLLEVMVSTTLAMALVGSLSVVLLHSAKLAATLSKNAYTEGFARAQLARQTVDLTIPIPGVVIELDPTTPEGEPCQLYKLSYATLSRTYEQWVTRGCAVR
jgi:type II secretory pathway pseudopilin PulG